MSPATAEATVAVTSCDNDGTWLVALYGEHDLATVTLLEQQTSGIWPRCRAVIIDLSEAEFISSSVIRWLTTVKCEAEARGAFSLSIVEGLPESVVARTLGLFCAPDVFTCYSTREAALAAAR